MGVENHLSQYTHTNEQRLNPNFFICPHCRATYPPEKTHACSKVTPTQELLEEPAPMVVILSQSTK